jgi:Putative zincin peptidase
MRFHLGGIPNSPDFSPDPPWSALREPSPWLFQFIATPIGIVCGGIVAVLWFVITPLRAAPPPEAWTLLPSFAGLVVVHELIHAATHPEAGRSPRSILGFWPSCLLFYAHYDGAMPRNRWIAVGLMPLLIISVFPLLIAAATQASSGWVAFVSSLNALCACGDILGAGFVLWQVPATAVVRNQGWRTYWRERETTAA